MSRHNQLGAGRQASGQQQQRRGGSGQLTGGGGQLPDRVWFKHDQLKEAFALGRIVDLCESGPVVQELAEPGRSFNLEYASVFPAEKSETKEVEDCCSLMHLNEASLLNNINLRYAKGKIYTYIGSILLAVNPYTEMKKLYSPDTLASYVGKSLGVRPPHVFAIADKAFRDMKAHKVSQSIIVSGESGAGKTESTKYILKYLCDSYGNGFGQLEEKIIQASHILEAFGNAKTLRNNNSSRFGKFIEIHFNGENRVIGGLLSCYLLERARVVSQSSQERNFHIFYQLCAGLTDELKQKFSIGSPEVYRYLSGGCTRFFRSEAKEGNLQDGIVDDFKDFGSLCSGLENVGISAEERTHIFATIAAILHLGNIEFQEGEGSGEAGGCGVVEASLSSLNTAADLLNLQPDQLRRALTTRLMQSKSENRQSDNIMVHLKPVEAASARDALAKSLYARLFDLIVRRINLSIAFQDARSYIGVLDIAGFEYFAVNGFEQFCINYCNEKLQQFFNQRILKDEQALYLKEGLGLKTITFIDNQDCIDLVELKLTGIMSILDEESKLPGPSYEHFTQQVHSTNSQHFRLALPRTSKLKEHRQLRDEHGFIIRHFAGAVCYQTVNFIEKNNDALHASLESLLQESKSPFVKDLFISFSDSSMKKQGRLNFISVGSKFKKQLGELMEKLSSTGTGFVRCIKPNDKMAASVFESKNVFSQLQCSGMAAVLELMQEGFPSRALYSSIYDTYRHHLPAALARLDPKFFCKALFKALGLSDKDFQFGTSKVFFKAGKFAEFDTIMNTDTDNLVNLVEKVKTWLIRSRWRRAQYCALEVVKLKNKILYRRQALVKIQAQTRKVLARRVHLPRLRACSRLNRLADSLQQLRSVESELTPENNENSAGQLQDKIDQARDKIKRNERMPATQVGKLVEDLTLALEQSINRANTSLQQQKRLEEERRRREKELEEERRRQEELEKIREAKLALERRRQEELEAERRRVEEEAEKAQAEEAERQRRREESERDLQRQLEETEKKYAALQKQMEQERRDHELALRLVAESKKTSFANDASSPPEPSPLLPDVITKGEEGVSGIKAGKKSGVPEYNLSKWKYAELRDTINTSCDIPLLEACKEEFHRRLKVYHSWKSKNYKKQENLRTPLSLIQEAESSKESSSARASKNNVQSDSENRYFKVPFVKDSVLSNLNKAEGWWLAHFQGQWIRRQIEVHEGKTTIFLKAGVHDIEMCELKLEETGLTRKKGAEILEQEFEQEWCKQHLLT